MNTILGLFVFLTLIVTLAWLKRYRLSIILFVLFLLAAFGVFAHDITDALQVEL